MKVELVQLLFVSTLNPCDLLAEWRKWRKYPWICATFLSIELTVKAIKKRGKVRRESERGWKYGTGERGESDEEGRTTLLIEGEEHCY